MKTAEFNTHYELDRKARGIRAVPKNTAPEPPEILTADGAPFDANERYFFFDVDTREVRQSIGLKRTGEHLCTFGLKVVAVAKLRINRNDALADGQEFFKSEIEQLQARVKNYELEKTPEARSLKSFLMAKE